MKQYRKIRSQPIPMELSKRSKLSQSFFKSKKNNRINQLKMNWEIYLSTYQYNKQNLFFERVSPSNSFCVDLKDVNRENCGSMSFESEKVRSILEAQSTLSKIFSFARKKKFSHKKNFLKDINFLYLNQNRYPALYFFNYFFLAKLVNLLGMKYNIQHKFRQFIQINTKYFELEQFFHINFLKNTSFFYWISYLFIEQIYQFIQMNSLFFYQAKLISPFGPVWGKKNKIEIQKNGKYLFLKNKDLLMLKWYQKKIHTWYEAQAIFKETSFHQLSQDYKRLHFAPTSPLRLSLLGKGCAPGVQDTISYSQDETKNLSKTFGKDKCFMLHNFGIDGERTMSKNWTKLSNKFMVLRALRVIKKMVKKSQVTTQVELIKKLNEVIGTLADPFIITNASKFNRIISQLLWRWGLVRHRNQKAKWIKNRYWSLQ